MNMPKKQKRIYLDYAAITPIDKKVVDVLHKQNKSNFYNPSSLYFEGRKVKNLSEEARKSIAKSFQCKIDEIYITSGGTESNNIAIQGVYRYQKNILKRKKIHMITSTIEHSSVLEAFRYIEAQGVMVTYVSPDEEGLVRPEMILKYINKDTVLISLMYGNNEIGTVNNISRISKDIKNFTKKNKINSIIIHTDASQGACYLNMRADYLGVDLITIDGSKLYGPRGTGVLYIKRGTKISPLFLGGGHERGIRSGTENIPAILGLAEALKICEKQKISEQKRLSILRESAFQYLTDNIPGLLINGSKKERLPNNINFCINGLDSEFLVIKLDLLGIACSSVTSCKNIGDDSSSYVIEELDKARKKLSDKINSRNNSSSFYPSGSSDCSKSSIRLSLGRFTTLDELKRALKIIVKTALALK
jgi:cysteine desulfurase